MHYEAFTIGLDGKTQYLKREADSYSLGYELIDEATYLAYLEQIKSGNIQLYKTVGTDLVDGDVLNCSIKEGYILTSLNGCYGKYKCSFKLALKLFRILLNHSTFWPTGCLKAELYDPAYNSRGLQNLMRRVGLSPELDSGTIFYLPDTTL